MAFIDIDEFITFSPLSKYSNVKQFIKDRNNADEILLNWMTYGDNGYVRDNGEGVLNRFIKPLPYSFSPFNLFGKKPYNCHVKQILRRGLDVHYVMPHASECNKGMTFRVIDADGNEITPLAIQPKYTFLTCYVRHFYTKSLEEFIATKIARRIGVDSANTVYDLSSFFMYNRVTIQKFRRYKAASKYYFFSEKKLLWWIKQSIKMYLIVPLMYVFEKK